jgi:hypothetical protein
LSLENQQQQQPTFQESLFWSNEKEKQIMLVLKFSSFQFIITQHKIMFPMREKHDYFVRLIESWCEASTGRNDDRFGIQFPRL